MSILLPTTKFELAFKSSSCSCKMDNKVTITNVKRRIYDYHCNEGEREREFNIYLECFVNQSQ